MVNPKPVPPYLRIVEPSTWEKGSNMSAWASGTTPIPVSLTSKRRSTNFPTSSAISTRITDSPCSVNLIALPMRFIRIWRNRMASPLSEMGTSFPIRYATSSPLLRARSANSSTTRSATSSFRSKLTVSSSSFSASIFEKSRMLLITLRSTSPELCTISTNLRCLSLKLVSESNSVMPKTPFIGVRSSWLTLARN